MSKYKILAVDDSPTILKILDVILKQAGYEIFLAHDGLEGIRTAKEIKPDLMILDFIMPKMNGFQVCKAIRKDADLKDVPIILMSAKGEKVGAKFIDLMGAIDYLTKPFSPEALLTLIPQVLKKKEGTPSADLVAEDAKPRKSQSPTVFDPVQSAQDAILETIKERIISNFKSVAEALTKAKSGNEVIEIINDILSESLNNELFDQLKTKFEKISSASTPEGISMKGLLSQVPLPEVFQFAKFQNHTGLLRVTNVNQTANIFMRGGTIAFATFADPNDDNFREKILQETGLEEYSINKAVRLSEQRNCSVVETVVNEQLLSKSNLFALLDRQTRTVVYEVLIWTQGSFSFHLVEKHNQEVRAIDLGITMDQLVMDGLRRLDELKVMQQHIHSDHQVFAREAGKPVDMSKLSEQQSSVLPLLDGNKNFGQLKSLLNLDTYEITKALFDLLKAGYIKELNVNQKTVNE